MTQSHCVEVKQNFFWTYNEWIHLITFHASYVLMTAKTAIGVQ